MKDAFLGGEAAKPGSLRDAVNTFAFQTHSKPGKYRIARHSNRWLAQSTMSSTSSSSNNNNKRATTTKPPSSSSSSTTTTTSRKLASFPMRDDDGATDAPMGMFSTQSYVERKYRGLHRRFVQGKISSIRSFLVLLVLHPLLPSKEKGRG